MALHVGRDKFKQMCEVRALLLDSHALTRSGRLFDVPQKPIAPQDISTQRACLAENGGTLQSEFLLSNLICGSDTAAGTPAEVATPWGAMPRPGSLHEEACTTPDPPPKYVQGSQGACLG
jgi:hypothetical protein